jgi:hypothetical protein
LFFGKRKFGKTEALRKNIGAKIWKAKPAAFEKAAADARMKTV